MLYMLSWQQAQAMEKVSLKLQWLDQFQFAGYYVAKEKGFYEKAGLDVEIIPFTFGSPNVVNDVVEGRATYGTGRSSLLAAHVKGLPVVALSAIFQETPSVLLTRDDTGIEHLSDLIGRRIMITPDELGAASTIGMLASEGLRVFDVVRMDHSYNLDDLINKKTDAMACYVSNEPFVLKEKGVGFNSFSPKDFGQNYYGDLLFTSQKELKTHPGRVKRFKAASLMGWAYAFDHIDETVNLIKRSYNGQKKSVKSLTFEGQELKKLAYQDGLPLGHISKAKFTEIAKLYYNLGILPEVKELDSFVLED
ncbi:ABC transporter substrate-binding protein [Candidatus Terasakiella magnetica]|nr:ABC transporter substrate-binding protein [Candidatus Terasakiella magnetica]